MSGTRGGMPLAALRTGANRHDAVVCADLLDAVPRINQPSGRHRWGIERTWAWLAR